MISELRQATKKLHSDLEDKMFSKEIMNGNLKTDQLIDLLKINYMFYQAVEEFLELPTYKLSRSRLAFNDLNILNGEIPKNVDYGFRGNCLSYKYGVLYVSLGATLGSKLIAKKLDKNPLISSGSYTFYSTTDNVFLLWKKFLDELKNPKFVLSNKIIEGGVDAFEFFTKISNQINKKK